jgi:putative acetyltransferase
VSEILRGLREAVDGDAAALAELIGGVYAEYPGCVLDLPGVDHDLTGIRTHLAAQGGRLWVLPGATGLRACVGYAPNAAGIELKRLYVHPDARRSGVGSALTSLVVELAAALQVRSVDLWSDTRFADAHRHYERHGWTKQPESRELNDPSDTTEFHFTREVAPARADAKITWHSDNGTSEDAMLVLQSMATHLQGQQRGGLWRYGVTTDDNGLTRDVVVTAGERSVRLSSDGLGRWWRNGFPDPALDSCTDVDIEVTPATNTLPIRRAMANGHDSIEVTAAWIRWPDLAVTRSQQRYVRAGDGWRYQSGGDPYDLEVDGHGLVRRYGDGAFVAD